MTLVLRYAARSDRGLVRSNNQDSGYAGSNLFVVADGMGGHAGGDVASSLAITRLERLDRPYESTAAAEKALRDAISDTAVELIDKADPQSLAVLNDAGRWTYAEMADLSDRIARLLEQRPDGQPVRFAVGEHRQLVECQHDFGSCMRPQLLLGMPAHGVRIDRADDGGSHLACLLPVG